MPPKPEPIVSSSLFWKTCMIRADSPTDIAGKNPAATMGVGVGALSA
jgi:hypothetical protein